MFFLQEIKVRHAPSQDMESPKSFFEILIFDFKKRLIPFLRFSIFFYYSFIKYNTIKHFLVIMY